jgi:hypothetical protein
MEEPSGEECRGHCLGGGAVVGELNDAGAVRGGGVLGLDGLGDVRPPTTTPAAIPWPRTGNPRGGRPSDQRRRRVPSRATRSPAPGRACPATPGHFPTAPIHRSIQTDRNTARLSRHVPRDRAAFVCSSPKRAIISLQLPREKRYATNLARLHTCAPVRSGQRSGRGPDWVRCAPASAHGLAREGHGIPPRDAMNLAGTPLAKR